jgi:hypothetical protein
MSEVPNIWLLSVDRDERDWCVITVADGRRRVVSRHPSRESAEAAARSVNEAGLPTPGQRHEHDQKEAGGVDGSGVVDRPGDVP